MKKEEIFIWNHYLVSKSAIIIVSKSAIIIASKSVFVRKMRFNILPEYTVLEIQFRSVKWTVITRICKDFEQLFIPFQTIQDYSSVLM